MSSWLRNLASLGKDVYLTPLEVVEKLATASKGERWLLDIRQGKRGRYRWFLYDYTGRLRAQGHPYGFRKYQEALTEGEIFAPSSALIDPDGVIPVSQVRVEISDD